jgi:hypothetical protein
VHRLSVANEHGSDWQRVVEQLHVQHWVYGAERDSLCAVCRRDVQERHGFGKLQQLSDPHNVLHRQRLYSTLPVHAEFHRPGRRAVRAVSGGTVQELAKFVV